jgi:hypothetical protein
VIAAHQYLKAKCIPAFIDDAGKAQTAKKDYFVKLGKAVIEKFIS